MRVAGIVLMLLFFITPVLAEEKVEGPTNEKAQKTYKVALEHLSKGRKDEALDNFKKADKQDGGQCLSCKKKMIQYGIELRDWKTAEAAAGEGASQGQGDKDVPLAHYEFGVVLFDEGLDKNKDELFSRAHEEMTKALAAFANFPDAIFADGQALARLKQDDAAKTQFEKFVKLRPADDLNRQRALRFISQPELARARMAPVFAVTTTDGQRVSLDDLKGKVLLIDFWATWCAPCKEALPRIRQIAKKFQGQPLVIMSVSLDEDEKKWKDFVGKNQMTWPQYRDGGFTGQIPTLLGVHAIPEPFNIDSDGVMPA